MRAEVGDPREGELRRLDALGGCELVQLVDEFEVVVEVFALETRDGLLECAVGDVLGRLPLAGDEAPAEGRVGEDGDLAVFAVGDDLLDLLVEGPERDFDLDDFDGRDLGSGSLA